MWRHITHAGCNNDGQIQDDLMYSAISMHGDLSVQYLGALTHNVSCAGVTK